MTRTAKADTWMAFYVSDYLRDTMHLTTELHGAYFLLLMHAWTRGGRLPNDDTQLAGIAKMAPAQWRRAKPILMAFFGEDDGGLFQKRAVEEAEKAQRLSDIRREAGQRGGRPPKSKQETKTESSEKPKGFANGNLTGSQNETPSPSPPSDEGLDADASLSDRPDPTPEPKRRLTPTKTDLDAIWGETPRLGRERSSRKDLERAVTAAMRRGQDPAQMRLGVRAAYASSTYSGDHAKGVHRLIEADRWLSFLETEVAPAVAQVSWPGPADLRAAVVTARDEGFARSYLDPAGWRNGPDRVVLCRNEYAARKLNDEVPDILLAFEARAVFEARP